MNMPSSTSTLANTHTHTHDTHLKLFKLYVAVAILVHVVKHSLLHLYRRVPWKTLVAQVIGEKLLEVAVVHATVFANNLCKELPQVVPSNGNIYHTVIV